MDRGERAVHLSESDLLKYNKAVLNLHSWHNLQSFHEALMQGARVLTPYESGNIYHLDPQNVYLVDFSFSEHQKYVEKYLRLDKDPIKNECLAAGLTRSRASRISDIKQKVEWDEEAYREMMLPFGFYHTAGVDLIFKGEYAKRISIHREKSRPDFSEKEIVLLRLYTDQIDLAFKRLKTEEAAASLGTEEFHPGEGLCVFNKLAECVYSNSYANQLFQEDVTGVFHKLAELSRQVIRLAKMQLEPYHYGGSFAVNRRKLVYEFTPCRGSDGYLAYALTFYIVGNITAKLPQVVSLASVK